MIQLLQSNDMSVLVNTFVRQARVQQDQLNDQDPFLPTIIVVQSLGIGQWLKHQIALHSGIAANIECILPADLIWRLYKSVLPQHQLPEISPFNRNFITWRISEILPECQSEEFESIQTYLKGKGDNILRTYQLSSVIAGLFDQYLLYRPDWISEWEEGVDDESQPWQSILWRKLIQQSGMNKKQHRGNLHSNFIKSLRQQEPKLDAFPKNISVFGLSSLPAMHMQALQAVGQYLDIGIYFLNPCEHYWGDIVSERDLAKKSIKKMLNKSDTLVDEDYFDVGNPLLSSMGKQGREYLELLLESDDIQTIEYFKEQKEESVLAKIQNDILHLDDGKDSEQSTELEFSNLQIHASHSRQREIEILYDHILHLLEREVSPSEIIVMAPNISDYAPYIKTSFQGKLRYSITDQALNEESMIVDVFETILNLPESRFTSLDIISLLETPAISRKLNIDKNDLEKLHYWIKETGIRWELDGDSKSNNWDLPPREFNTWVFGLKRLLLGFAMSNKKFGQTSNDTMAKSIENIAPFEITPSDTPLIEKLIGFIRLLSKYRSELGQEKKGTAWLTLLLSITEALFYPENEDELALNQIRDIFLGLIDQLNEAQFTSIISPQLIRYWFSDQLSNMKQTRGLISGGITFANLVPMRSIPFEGIFLIGMNDKEYPREDQQLGFDLMRNTYRKGDRSKKVDDRYLFLEALISAKSYFYLSYQGRSIKDNKPLPPSVLVSDLQDYLKGLYGTDFTIEHPLQPFNEKYFNPEYPLLKTYNHSWYKALRSSTQKKPFVDAIIGHTLATKKNGTKGNDTKENRKIEEENQLIELHDLINFFRHPAKNYLQKQLGIHLGIEQVDLQETESFKLDGLESYKLSDSALEVLVKQYSQDRNSLNIWKKQVRAEGMIMEGVIGDGILNREIEKAKAIYNLLLPHLKPQQIYSGDIKLNSHILIGDIDCMGDEYIDYRTGSLRERQKIEVWIKHLFRAATGANGSSRLISKHPTQSKKASEAIFKEMPEHDAIQYLCELTELYTNSLGAPFAYLPEASAVYFDTYLLENDVDKALDKAHKHFNSGRAPGEGLDSYYKRLYQFPLDKEHNFSAIAERILSPMRQYWEKL
ncbi:MAG: exodeoxyribonuclease V gamma subunit [Flavobacterium sp.]